MAESLAPPLHEDLGIQGRRRSHPPVRCRDLSSLPEDYQATGAISPTLVALHPWHQMARALVERRSPQESQPAQHSFSILHLVQLHWAGHVTRMEDVRVPKAVLFSELQEKKSDRGAPRKRYKDQLKRQLAQEGIRQQP